jgi:hypothetical protein
MFHLKHMHGVITFKFDAWASVLIQYYVIIAELFSHRLFLNPYSTFLFFQIFFPDWFISLPLLLCNLRIWMEITCSVISQATFTFILIQLHPSQPQGFILWQKVYSICINWVITSSVEKLVSEKWGKHEKELNVFIHSFKKLMK